MAKLIIKRASGEVSEHEITPIIEYAFEQHFKKGFHKYFREDEQQSAVYWLAWECIRRSGETPISMVWDTRKLFGACSRTSPAVFHLKRKFQITTFVLFV